MAEYRDAYTRSGEPLGRTLEKHAKAQPGDYFLHAIDILRCSDGRYVLQQRSLKARYYAGVWDVTGGGVRSGETPLQAGIREAYEELGIVMQPENMHEIHKYYADWDDGTGLILYVYGCDIEIPEGGFVIQPDEVNDVKLVSFDEFYQTVMINKDEAFGEALINFESEFKAKTASEAQE